MNRNRCPRIALALFWITLGLPCVRAASAVGVVQEVTKDTLTVKTERLGVVTFKVSENLLKGLPEPTSVMKDKFADLKKDMRIGVDYHRKNGVDICIGIAIGYRVVEGLVQDRYEDAFVVRDSQKRLFAFNASEKLLKNEADETRDKFTDKFADLKKGQRVRVLYGLDHLDYLNEHVCICVGLQIEI